MPVFVGAGTSSFMKAGDGVGFTRLNTTQRNALSAVQGQVIFNTSTGVLEYYDGSSWAKVSAVLAVLNSISGDIAAGAATNLTLSGTGFLSSGLVVNFAQSADSIDVNVTVNPSSDTAASVSVPASVYNNVTAGRVVTIKVTNSDGSTSQGVNKTALALPSGGSIQTYSGYRSHKFTSSGTWTNTSFVTSVDVLIVAGGGGGGADNSGGGGAGGMLVQTGVSVSAQNYSISIGGGGTGAYESSGDGGPYATNGSNSSALGYTAVGGGRGGSAGGANGSSGGSGGGGSGENANGVGGAGTSGQGNDGGNHNSGGGGGGGGRGAAGQRGNIRGSNQGGLGGVGSQNNYETGSNQYYAAGGNGGNENGDYDTAAAVNGIGGRTNPSSSTRGQNGVDGTGAGGGACTHDTSADSPAGGDGGDGVVIIRYAI